MNVEVRQCLACGDHRYCEHALCLCGSGEYQVTGHITPFWMKRLVKADNPREVIDEILGTPLKPRNNGE